MQTDVDKAFAAGRMSVSELALAGIRSEIPVTGNSRLQTNADTLTFVDGAELLQGRIEFTDPALPRLSPYDRLPSAAEAVVDQPVWNLSRFSTGMYVY